MTLEETFRIALAHAAVIKNGEATMRTADLLGFATQVEAETIERCANQCKKSNSSFSDPGRRRIAGGALDHAEAAIRALSSPVEQGRKEASGRVCEYCNEVHKDSRLACPEMYRAQVAASVEGRRCDKLQGYRVKHKHSEISRVVDAIHEDQAWHKYAKEFEQHEKPARRDFTISACHEGPTPGTENKGGGNV